MKYSNQSFICRHCSRKYVGTLSEQALLRRHGYNIEVEEIRRAWEDEKDSQLSAIHSLKELLAETHKDRDASKVGRGENNVHAVCTVISRASAPCLC